MKGYPKIFHIETGTHLYGGPKQVYYLIRGLIDKGFGENILICPKGSDIANSCKNMCKVYEIPMYGDGDFFSLFRLIRLIKRDKPHIVHVHSRRGADVWGGLAAKLTHTRTLVTRRVDNPENKYLLNLKSLFFDEIVVISKGIKKVMISQGVKKNIGVIPSAVDFDFYNIEGDNRWFLREFSVPPNVKKVGMIAQFIPRKGHFFLLDSIPYILNSVPDVVFLLFGKGSLLTRVKDEIKQRGLEDSVKVVGFRWDMERILPCLDLVVHPAFMEGLGVSLMQASAASVPVVASSVGGIPEIIWDGENGLLFPKKNTEFFVKSVVKLLKDPFLRKRMGNRGKEIMKKYFSIQKMTESYISVYKKLLDNNF